MAESIVHRRDTASTDEIARHLRLCDEQFLPPLHSRANIEDYAQKIANRAVRFEAWSDLSMVGLVAVYANDVVGRTAFITSVSVLPEWTGRGIATRLVRECIEYAKLNHFQHIKLEVAVGQRAAIRLYEKGGFTRGQTQGEVLGMQLDLEGE